MAARSAFVKKNSLAAIRPSAARVFFLQKHHLATIWFGRRHTAWTPLLFFIIFFTIQCSLPFKKIEIVFL
jgi:hypothetical protein